jgi:hypothetical protein
MPGVDCFVYESDTLLWWISQTLRTFARTRPTPVGAGGAFQGDVLARVAQVVGLPLELDRAGHAAAGEAADHGQQRRVLRGEREQLAVVVGQVERGAHSGDAGH